MELADLVVVNKADLDPAAAARAVGQLESAMQTVSSRARRGRATPRVLATSATRCRRRWRAVWEVGRRFGCGAEAPAARSPARRETQSRAWLWERIDAGLRERFAPTPRCGACSPETLARGRRRPAAGLGRRTTAVAAPSLREPSDADNSQVEPERESVMHDIIEQLEAKRAPRPPRRRPEAHRRAARQGQAHRARAHRAAASTPARSRNGTCSSSTAATTSAWRPDRPPGDGVVTGYGMINGRLVFVFSQDFTVFGGALSEAHAEKICKVMDQAMKVGAPVIGLNDSGGARIQEGVASLGGYAEVFQRNVIASGVVPQISLIMGPCAGGAVYSPAMTDFIFMVKDSSYMFVTGPEVGEDGDARGGERRGPRRRADPHDQERRRRPRVRERRRRAGDAAPLLRLPAAQQPREGAVACPSDDPAGADRPLARHAGAGQPEQALRHQGADRQDGRRRRLLRAPARAREEHRHRLRPDGRAGRSASSPTSRWCSPAASTSRARSRRRASSASATPSTSRWSPSSTCPASCPAPRRSTAASSSTAPSCSSPTPSATVPKITVITRKAYGGAYDVMSSKHLRGDVNFAWPNAEIAVMGAKGAVEIIFRDEKGDPDEARRARGRVQGQVRQPVHRQRARLHRRRDPAARDEEAHLPLAGDARATRRSTTRGASTATSLL